MAGGLLGVGWLQQARPPDGGTARACSWCLAPPTLGRGLGRLWSWFLQHPQQCWVG